MQPIRDRSIRESEEDYVISPVRLGKVVSRYKDAYQYAKFIAGLGSVVTIAGIILGTLSIIAGTVSHFRLLEEVRKYSPNSSSAITTSTIFAWIILVIFPSMVGMLTAFVIGKLIKASAQFMQATLDTAVYSCPVMDTKQKMEIIAHS